LPGPNTIDSDAPHGPSIFLRTRKYNVSAVIEHLEGEARERLILWLRRRMQECNITMEALQHALQQDIEEVRKIRYRDAWGNTWTGEGEHPEWLRRAVAAGQSVDHFLCA
jgi:DNA-binding protein H-NS